MAFHPPLDFGGRDGFIKKQHERNQTKREKMKAAVVYSTLTGNTKKVAEAFCTGLGEGAEIFDVDNAFVVDFQNTPSAVNAVGISNAVPLGKGSEA